MEAYLYSGRYADVVRVYEQMRELNVTLDTITIDLVKIAYTKSELWDKLMDLNLFENQLKNKIIMHSNKVVDDPQS